MKKFWIFSAMLFGAFVACKNEPSNSKIGTIQPTAVLLKQDSATRIEPMNWWIGFKNPSVELLVHHKNIGQFEVKLGKYEGVRLVKTSQTDNPNYLFVEISVYATAKAGLLPLIFEKNGEQLVFEFPLLARENGPKAQGVTSADELYLVMPDRFANGDTSNDNLRTMREPKMHRDSLSGRHGGDLKGIENHLDYLKDLGVSAIWLNPELENDQASASYHGYAITDFYHLDRRIGTNDDYRNFVKKCHENGLKVVKDVVINHCGNGHWWMRDLPTGDWMHQFDTFTRTNYRAPTIYDPYASEADRRLFSDGWFDRAMPDLNQRNPFLGRYLIQNIIWWIEFSGLDGLRIDTYTYSDQNFMSKFCEAVRMEFPSISIVGEVWEKSVAVQSYFADNQPVKRTNFDSNLPGMIDFQLQFAVSDALNHEQGWVEGVDKLYYTLAQDYLYDDPTRNLIFLDNHDMSRFYSQVGENVDKWKSGMVWLMTTRGVPQLYYGSELMFSGEKSKGDGALRQEMPGGWAGDRRSVFKAEERTVLENEGFEFTKKLLAFRKSHAVIQNGKTMQFAPEKSVYTYFRYDENNAVMVVLNTANSDSKINMRRFAERLVGFTKAKNGLTGEEITDLTAPILIKKNAPLLLELIK